MTPPLREQFPHALIVTVDVDRSERPEVPNMADFSIRISVVACGRELVGMCSIVFVLVACAFVALVMIACDRVFVGMCTVSLTGIGYAGAIAVLHGT